MSAADARLRWTTATAADARLLWRWRNERQTRLQSGSSARVAWPEHRAWLERGLARPGFGLWIARLSGKPVGQLRLELRPGGRAEVSVSVDRAARGRGLGTQMLRHAPARVGGKPVRAYVARVKADNVASTLAFVKAGFRFARLETLGGAVVYVLERKP